MIAALILIPVAFGGRTRVKEIFGSSPPGGSARSRTDCSCGTRWSSNCIYLVDDRPLFTGGLFNTFALTMAFGLVYATVSYYGVERPLQVLGSQRRGDRPARAGIRRTRRRRGRTGHHAADASRPAAGPTVDA